MPFARQPSDIRRAATRSIRASAVVFSLCFCACTVTLISRFDEVFDASTTNLQRRMDAHLTRLIALGPASDSATYAANAPFYTTYQVDLRALLLRARSLPLNSQSAQQVEAVSGSVEEIRHEHERRMRLDTAYVRQARDQLNQSWQNVLALELAKKR